VLIVVLPTDLDAALAALATTPDALVLAGGTDVMVEVNAGRRRFEDVIALRNVDELRTVMIDPTARTLRLGAGVTYTRLLADDVVAVAPALAHAARTVGSPPIRNAGTIGGNLATASPAGDTLPVLLALDAVVGVASATNGSRTLPVAAFFTGPKRNSLQPGELITHIDVPIVHGHQEFRKVGVRNAMVISVASVATVIDDDARRVSFGLGSVGPVPLRAAEAETLAAERFGDTTAAADIGDLVAAAARPIDDHRGTAAYRRHAIAVLATRSIRAAWA